MVHGHRVIAATLLLAAGSTRATVYTHARVDDTASGAYYDIGYNMLQREYLEIGPYGPTFNSAPCGGCTAATSGTTTPGTAAVVAADTASLLTPALAPATAFGRADLRSGQLGVSATGTNYNRNGYNYYVRGFSAAGFSDGLNFTVAGAGSGTVTDIAVTVDLHGHMSGAASLDEQFGFGTASFENIIRSDVGTAAHFTNNNVGGWVSYDFTPDTPDHVVFHGVYALTGASQHVDLGEFLFADSAGGANDYAHTSDLSFQLPTGVTYTSDSGALLTGAVPEPASWALLLAGFGLTGIVARRRRRAWRAA